MEETIRITAVSLTCYSDSLAKNDLKIYKTNLRLPMASIGLLLSF
jgi:hypothetical protein